MSTYIKFKGALYRKADRRMDEILSRKPGRNITWGPDEWPSDEYLETMQEKPPINKEQFDFLQQQVSELQGQVARAGSPEDKRVLMRSLGTIEHKIIEIRHWLYEHRPGPDYRLKHWAKTK